MEELKAHYFDALREAAKAINSTLKIAEVLEVIVRTTTEATKAKGCSLLLLDEEMTKRKYLVHTATYGLSEHYLRKGVIAADRSLADALKGEVVIVSDVSSDPRLQYPAEAIKEGIGSMLCVPLTARGVVVGAIRIYNSQKQDFSTHDIKLLIAIADLSAIAVQNERMHNSLRKAYETCRVELSHWQP